MQASVGTGEPVMAEIIRIFRSVLNQPDLELTPCSTSDEVAGWDSMTHIAVVVAAECRFGVAFQGAEIETLRSVGELVRAIEAKRAPAG